MSEKIYTAADSLLVQQQETIRQQQVEIDRLKGQRDRLLRSLKNAVMSHGYVSYISEEEKQEDDEVIEWNALIAEIEAGK